MGRNPKWDNFAELTARCYKSVNKGNTLDKCWYDAARILFEIIDEERGFNSGFARELGDIEKLTDFKFNIEGLIFDYMDRLAAVRDYGQICELGNRIINTFDWKVESSFRIRIKVIDAMNNMGNKEAALEYCRDWIRNESQNMNKAVAVFTLMKDYMAYDEARRMIDEN